MGKSKKINTEFSPDKLVEFFKQIENSYRPEEYLEIVNEYIEKNYSATKFAAFKYEYSLHELNDILKSQFSGQIYKKLIKANKSKFKWVNGFFKLDNLYIYPIKDKSKVVNYIFVFQDLNSGNMKNIQLLCKGIQSTYRLAKSNYDYGIDTCMIKNANLISQICHDFNSVISIVKISNEIKNPKLPERLNSSVRLTKDILLYVREMDLLTSKINITELIDSSVEKLEVPSEIKIKFNYEIKNIELDIDVELFDRVISEVIGNAITAMKGKAGKIKISVQTQKTESIFGDKNWLVIEVEDNGTGIQVDFLPMVKNPFFTTMKSSNHYGLGLSIAEKIVIEHSGFINISSEHGKNTIVSIFLPL